MSKNELYKLFIRGKFCKLNIQAIKELIKEQKKECNPFWESRPEGKNTEGFKTMVECQSSYDELYWDVLGLSTKYSLEQLCFFTFTIKDEEDATREKISKRMRHMLREMRKKGGLISGVKFNVKYLSKYEYQERGVLHVHVIFVFENVEKAPHQIVSKMRELWAYSDNKEDKKSQDYISRTHFNSIEEMANYMKKNDKNNQNPDNKKLSRFRKGEQLTSKSKNWKLDEQEVCIDKNLRDWIVTNLHYINEDRFFYEDENGETQEHLEHLYFKILKEKKEMFENVVLNNSEDGVFQDNYMEKRQDVFTSDGNIIDEDYDDKFEEINHEGYFWEFEEDGYVYRIRRV